MMAQLDLFAESDAKYASAEQWCRENPEAYAAVIGWAHEDYNAGRQCAMQRYIEFLRDPDMIPRRYVHRIDAVYLVNHNVRSALTRMLLVEYPYLPFAIRKSTCDAGHFTSASPNPRLTVERGLEAAGEGHGDVPAVSTRSMS